MDLMPTLIEAARTEYPQQMGDQPIQPIEGKSLLSAMRGKRLPARSIGFDHQAAHAFRQGDWKVVFPKRMPDPLTWELYNLAEDRCELNDLAEEHPQRLAAMVSAWEQWARRVGVTWDPYPQASVGRNAEPPSPKEPKIANRAFSLLVEIRASRPDGVVIAQGGNQHGYALHFVAGKPAFDVRINGRTYRLVSESPVSGEITLEATLSAEAMTLTINQGETISRDSPGFIPTQPLDGFNVGFDDCTAAGDYIAPNRFNGQVLKHEVRTTKPTPNSVD